MHAWRAVLQYYKKPLIFYGALSLIVMLPLLAPGFVLTVDLVFTPHITLPKITSPDFLWWLLIKLVSFVLPVVVIEKLILLAIVFLCGFGMYRWLATITDRVELRTGVYLAGLLYAVNPFCYSRFMTGQYLVLLGYALLPFFATSIYKAAQRRTSQKTAYLPGIWLALIATISLHMLGMALLLTIVLAVFLQQTKVITSRHEAVKFWLKVAVSFIVLSVPWLVASILGKGSAAQTTSGFTTGDLQAFHTYSGHAGTLLNVLFLHGFWADAKNLFIAPEAVYSWWWLPCLLIVLLVGLGYIKLLAKRDRLASALVAIGTLACILAMGATAYGIGGVNQWILHNVPFLKGYREPQKFVALLIFVYCYGFAFGVAALQRVVRRFSDDVRSALVLCIVAVVVLSAPFMPWAFRGQLTTSQYPADWAYTNDYFRDKSRPTAVFLPWHLYMPYEFSKRLIANPAPKFFTHAKIIASVDPEIGDASGYAQAKEQRTIAQIIQRGNQNSAALLYAQGVRYVIVAKDYDYHRYDSLLKQTGFMSVKNLQTLQVFKVVKE